MELKLTVIQSNPSQENEAQRFSCPQYVTSVVKRLDNSEYKLTQEVHTQQTNCPSANSDNDTDACSNDDMNGDDFDADTTDIDEEDNFNTNTDTEDLRHDMGNGIRLPGKNNINYWYLS